MNDNLDNRRGNTDRLKGEYTARHSTEYTGKLPDGRSAHSVNSGRIPIPQANKSATGGIYRDSQASGRQTGSMDRLAQNPSNTHKNKSQNTGSFTGRISKKKQEKQENKKRLIYLLFASFAAIFIICLALVLRNVSDTRVYNDYMDQARTSFYSTDFDSALTYLRKASSIDPSKECLAMMAQCYESQGNYDKALETLRKMDTSDPQVSSWIDSLEGRKAVIRESSMVTIAGKQYKGDTTGLALDNMGLGNNVIDEILQLYSLDNLSLAGNNISDISKLSTLGGLVTLNLSNNQISDISSLVSLTGLRTLYLDNNPITEFAHLGELTNLTTLSIKGMSITDKQLKDLAAALPNCAIHSESTEEELQDISFGGTTFKADVTELNLSGMGIQNISPLSNCKNLQKLNLSGNQISDLTPLMDIPNLQVLDISSNYISDLRPLMGITSLRSLNASYNYISNTVPLGSINGLTDLDLSQNNLSNFAGLKKLKSLQTLGLNNCGLTDEGLKLLVGLTGLRSLNIEDNQGLTGEAVEGLKGYLPACYITHSDLTFMVSIGGYMIQSDSTTVNLNSLNISDISGLADLDNPENVDLSNNNISNLYNLQNADNRLKIKNLNLAYNSIQDITPISSLINLETLDLSYNMISSETPVLNLRSLRQLDVTGTLLSPQQVRTIKDTLTTCVVISDYD